jgi:translation initiation factor 2-alpha kinase 1
MFSSISESRSLSSKELQEDIESFSIHSYSSSSLDSHNENSMFAQDGFTFEEPSELESTVKVMQATEEEDNQLQLEKLREKLSNIHSDAKKPEEPLTLYIQMELCGSTASGRNLGGYDHFYQGDEHHQHVQSFFEHVHSMHVQPRNTAKEHSSHSSLSSWLKATIEERSSSNPAIAAAKHREGLHFFLGAVQGVQHMHNCGVIHRDLKPDNIFIHGDVAKIGDFGLSKSLFSFETSASFLVEQKEKEQLMRLKRMMLGRDEYADQHTTALGTFTYASPEQLGSRFDHRLVLNGQVHAKSAKYSIKSDIFALGVILLELCCPFTTMMERSQVLTAVRHGVVPQKTLQKFPMEMALVLRMTAIHPSERPTSEEVAHQIKCLLSVDTVHVHSALDELQELQSVCEKSTIVTSSLSEN